jgi:hypothetical protein
MRTFVMKLAAWHRLLKDLEYARLRLAQAKAVLPRENQLGGFEQDVLYLQQACDRALKELGIAANAYIAAGRQQANSTLAEKQLPKSNRWVGNLERSPTTRQGFGRLRSTAG